GDLQDVPTGTALCSLDLSGLTPSTAIDHTYAAGQRASSRHQGANFDTLNRTIDASTGLTRITREPDGLATTWSYDALGRVVGIEPVVDQGAKIDIAYSRDAHGLERAAINSRANDSVSPNAFLGHAEVWLNHLGLVRTRRVLMPDGVQWATERTFYDVNDRPSNVSTWYLSAHGGSVASGESIAETKTFGRDPWGRPDRLELPGGHDVKFTFRGERTVDRIDSVGIWTSSTVVEKDLYRKETRDVHGRLVQVDLGATDETNGPSLTAKYTYDVADRLTQVRLEGADRHGAQASQTRTFSYDGRGFLLAESHPEAAPVTYSRYDARGNVGRKDAGGITLHFSYDAAERLTRVDENLGGGTSRPLRVLTYGVNASGDRALGKVKTATRWTYGRLPWGDGTDPFAVPVTETLTYGGLGGRISSRATDFLSGAHIFTQGWTYTPLGAVASIDYPRCTSGCDGLDAPARTVEHGYSQGWLTRIEGYADSIAYHPSGLVTRIDHANGAVESIEADPWNRSMPRNIRLQATNAAVELGTHRYDGVGNLIHHELDLGAVPFSELTESLPRATSQVQVADYGYDRQQRLVHFRNTANQQQDYVYDAFGNLQQVTTTTPDSSGTPSVLVRDLATSSTTNRLEGPLFTYDPRGNLTAWGHKSFEYDALGMLTQVNFPASTSIFTADNERLCALKHDPSTWNDEVFTLRDLDGRVLTMLRKQSSQSGEVTWTWLRDYVYRGPKLLAQETSQPSPEDRVHLHLDHLGSPRGLTDANGKGLASFHYYGFGERILSAAADRPMALKSPLQYTGHERDFHASWADDLDNMHARHYSPWLGRFLSVDPIDSSRLAALQTWGKYGYGRNNPLAFVDPDGRESIGILAAELDQRAFLRGEISAGELRSRRTSRAAGAAAGVLAIVAVRYAGGVLPIIGDLFLADDACACDDDTAERAPPDSITPTEHGQRRRDQARSGDSSRQIGDPNRVAREGQEYTDSETGNTIVVRGDRVLVLNERGEEVTRFKNSRKNTRKRIENGRWVPKPSAED
ncbi:MAG: RHS repeat-associated core domain-containing protein, partial [Acidobacteriota bacterium]